MKTLKNISFLLAFACAMPVVAIDQSEGAKEAVVAMMQEKYGYLPAKQLVEQQNADATNAVADTAEQPSVEIIVNSARNYAAAMATGMYGVVGGLAVMSATLPTTNSIKMALLAGGGTVAVAAIPALYFYKKYKAQFGENFKLLREIAFPDIWRYMIPLELAVATYVGINIAGFCGKCLGTVINGVANALGSGLGAKIAATTGIAMAVPSYIEARSRSDEKKPDSYYESAVKFMSVYAKNAIIMAFIGGASVPVLLSCLQK